MANKQAANFECTCGPIRLMQKQDPYKLRYPDCPNCGEMMDYVRPERGRRPTHNFDVPITMFSCGLIEGELKAFSLANREIDLTDQGVPIAKNRLEKKQILQYFGYQENT